MLDINAVAVFVQTVKAGSFAAAGRRLDQPANTVSRRVQQLEEQLGARLLQRSTRKLSLTSAGREFFERCVAGIEDIESAQLRLSETGQVPRGTVRVAVPADFFEFFPLQRVEGLLAEHPLLKLEFMLSDARVDLIEHAIDVAFRAGELEDSSYVARRLDGRQELILVATPEYLRARGEPESLAALAASDCVVALSAQGKTLWRLDGPEGAVEVRVGGRFAANTLLSQLRAVRAGLGIGLMPVMTVADEVHEGRLVRVLPQYVRRSSGLYAVYPSRRQLPRGVAVLIELVEAFFNEVTIAGDCSGAKTKSERRSGG
ncbi:LysR family transcriptional regulator [Lysobacter sp. CA199]|uniref:LysR family transcriptional regulator n=1 Tax=Lysobacter sp. CA199 TaxID=3455608 RepID=UPI003F8D5296